MLFLCTKYKILFKLKIVLINIKTLNIKLRCRATYVDLSQGGVVVNIKIDVKVDVKTNGTMDVKFDVVDVESRLMLCVL